MYFPRQFGTAKTNTSMAILLLIGFIRKYIYKKMTDLIKAIVWENGGQRMAMAGHRVVQKCKYTHETLIEGQLY